MYLLSACKPQSHDLLVLYSHKSKPTRRTLATVGCFTLNYTSPATADSAPLASTSRRSLFCHQTRFVHFGSLSLCVTYEFGVLVMASLRPTLSQLSLSQSNFPRKSTWNNFSGCFFLKRITKLQTFTASKSPSTSFRVCCKSQDTQNQNNGKFFFF